MIGRRISHYQVIEKLGAGGMGEIWKAQDSRLNRMVAIKVLTNASAGDSDRRRRFVQEAQAASALNHPNIITIYDITSDSDSEYMVMEYVAGKTLADLIQPGGVGVSKTLQYSVQIADALKAAHAAGIIHRDLKPGNVMVTESGLVKILDFGLAKISVATKLTEETQTMGAAPMTVEGSILGTVAYMSPEQAQGKPVDARSDIFSFGVVMYEMLTGTKAFAGDSAISTLTAILRDEVKPIEDLVPGVPPEVVEIIGLALRKDPKQRWQSMQVIHTVLAAQKQKYDSGVYQNSGFAQAQPVSAAPPPSSGFTYPPSAPSLPPSLPPSAPQQMRLPPKKWMWIIIGLSVAFWGKTCGSSRDRTKIDTNIPGVSVSIPGVTADTPLPRASKKAATLTNQSILDMLDAEVPEATIMAHIRASKTRFTLTTDEIIKLTKAGATPQLIEVMRNPSAPAPPEAPPPATPAPEKRAK
jgi:serine/threonine-protein kinase